MQIFVRNLDGKSITLDVEPTESVLSAKRKFLQKMNYRPNFDIRFLYQGKFMMDNMPIGAYGVEKESNVHLYVNPGRIFKSQYFSEIGESSKEV
uniref:Ubiquitin-like domain-containing protein n=1 Tax=Strongyloides papillosus TaxID=174720 RepID=A0A0N5B6K5_STREA